MNINVLSELERSGIKYEFASAEEIKVRCPFHNDETPSCAVNVKKSVFTCHSAECKKTGDIVTLLARYLQTTRAVVLADLSTRYEIAEEKIVNPQIVEQYHALIWSGGPLLQALYERGLTDDDLRKYRIGISDGRITIPIRNASGSFVNIRKYLPGAPGKDKMRNLKGYGSIRLFPCEQMKYNDIVLTGGECKAIVAARQLNQYGIGAITATAGESNWLPELSREFMGKRVWVIMDIDKGGQVSANERCLQIRPFASWVGLVTLPLDPDKYPKGDINDFVGGENGDLKPLLDECEEFIPRTSTADFSDAQEPENVDLSQAIHAKQTAKRIHFQSVISSLDTSPYVIPKDIEIVCRKDEKCCALCPVFCEDRVEFTIPCESPAILEMVNAPKGGQLDVIKAAIGVPRTCRTCAFNAKTHYNVEDARISPELAISCRNSDRLMQPALCIGNGLELNESYALTGRMFPNPKNQQATLLISTYDQTQDSLSTYRHEDLYALSVFWPDEWSVDGLERLLGGIYSDFEANVTRIFQRHDLHLSVDLVYHSPLLLEFDGKTIKGWAEALIVGDSSQGKSEVTCGSNGPGGLMSHYGLGEKIECKNATVAGLLGGLQKSGERWFVSWGVIPTHDKRLVILEELKGASQEVFSKLTDMRSSGFAEIPKIEKRKTHARTRLIALSNPRSDMKLRQYNYGIQAVKELIGALEDIRRFDFVHLVSSDEMNEVEINKLQTFRPQVPHVYTSELCRKLVLWAWTRKRDEVIFTEEATAAVLEAANYFCGKFTDAIPIVDKGSMRYKIARLSAALAARTFCCSEDFSTLYVLPCHVEYITRFLDRNYSSSVFGYADFTTAIKATTELEEPEVIRAKISTLPFPKDIIKNMLASNDMDIHDLQDWCGWERDEAQSLLSFFVRKHGVTRDGRKYRKTAPFISLLKEMLDSGNFADIPHFLRKEF